MDFNTTCNSICTVPQTLNINFPINDVSTIKIYDENCCEYDLNDVIAAYSLDNIYWTCDMPFNEVLANTIELNQDFYIRFKIKGIISKVEIDGELITDYSTSVVGCFDFDSGSTEESSNLYNPYANMENAISLAQQLSESVSSLVGIPCYYIKLNPDQNSKDLTFKEYTLFGVQDIKQIKLVIQDNQMPSSKPEFNEWGIDWQSDWETEITKGSFATAFGNKAQPMEGDLVYIPMMKRMWMVNEAYEEKRDGFMWVATTFRVALVKYQEKDSVDLGDAQQFVDNLVKTKYEDLFGEDEQQTLDSGEASLDAPKYAANNLYSVFESDATRKYITCDSLDIRKNEVYYKGTLISDSKYEFLRNDVSSKISYQKKYCGTELALSFLIYPTITEEFLGSVIQIGNVKIMIEQEFMTSQLYLNVNKNIKVDLECNNWNFVVFKWSKNLNFVDAASYRYTYDERIPIYKLSKQHYRFDIDNPISETRDKFDIELEIPNKSEIEINNFYGCISNFKLFDLYNDNVSELLQMYPTHQHLLINDTARRIVDMPGVKAT